MNLAIFEMNKLLQSCITVLFLLMNSLLFGQTNNPNVIYILADDIGYGDLSCYNKNGKISTPHLDRLAAEGAKFTDAHTTSSVCSPSRYSILTGRYSWRSSLKKGVLTGKSKPIIENERSTVGTVMKNAGYQTLFLGKWHVGWDWTIQNGKDFGGDGWSPEDFETIDFTKPIKRSPKDLGFDYYYALSGSLDMAPYVYVENDTVVGEVTNTSFADTKYQWWREGPISDQFDHKRTTPEMFERAIDFVKHNEDEKPFFIYLSLPSPHTPLLPTPEWIGKSDLSLYGDFTMMVDDYVGQLLNVIENRGLEEETLIIFTSDNGGSPASGIEEMKAKGHSSNGFSRGTKSELFDGGHRIPFIAKWAGTIDKNIEVDALISTSDLYATLADIVDAKMSNDEAEDSFSLTPFFNGKGENYQRESMIYHSDYGSFAIKKGKWKLILTADSGGWGYPNKTNDAALLKDAPLVQLYDMDKDASEQNNIMHDHPKVVESLFQEFFTLVEKESSKRDLRKKGEKQVKWKELEEVYSLYEKINKY